jgi:putative glutamine amidotransferase
VHWTIKALLPKTIYPVWLTKLYKITGADVIDVNTYHHEAIDRLGDGLIVSAIAEDGIIEAIETDDDRFVICLQSHPESVAQKVPALGKLMEAFIAEAAKPRKPAQAKVVRLRKKAA